MRIGIFILGLLLSFTAHGQESLAVRLYSRTNFVYGSPLIVVFGDFADLQTLQIYEGSNKSSGMIRRVVKDIDKSHIPVFFFADVPGRPRPLDLGHEYFRLSADAHSGYFGITGQIGGGFYEEIEASDAVLERLLLAGSTEQTILDKIEEWRAGGCAAKVDPKRISLAR